MRCIIIVNYHYPITNGEAYNLKVWLQILVVVTYIGFFDEGSL